MFADPQSITFNAVAKSLPAVSRGMDSSIYQMTDGSAQTFRLTVGHQYKRRNRITVRLDMAKVVPDPLIPATSVQASASCYLVIDLPPAKNITDAEAVYMVTALKDWLATSTNISRTVNGET